MNMNSPNKISSSKDVLGKEQTTNTYSGENLNLGLTVQKQKDLNDSLSNNKIFEEYRNFETFEDTEKLDYSYNKIITDMQIKFNLLQSIRQQNEVVEELLREKFEQTPVQMDKQKSDSLKQMVEARRRELVELLDLQIEDLVKFEDDVRNIAGGFPKDAGDPEARILKEKVHTLHVNIGKKVNELRLYKEDILAKSGTESMMESIGFINSLNEKLTKSVEQMTIEVSKVRSEVGTFNYDTAIANSVVLSMAPKKN